MRLKFPIDLLIGEVPNHLDLCCVNVGATTQEDCNVQEGRQWWRQAAATKGGSEPQ